MEEKDMQQQENHLPENDIDINSDADVSGTAHLTEPVAEGNEVDKLKLEVEELKDKYLRQAAEFDNFRRRTAKERIELIQTAGREVITEMLEVMDDCDRAQLQFDKQQDAQSIKEGIQLIFTKLRTKLTSKGLKPMETRGQDFDADKHEAITEIPAPSEDLKGKVIDEVEKGYYLNDKIIRFAKVVVGK